MALQLKNLARIVQMPVRQLRPRYAHSHISKGDEITPKMSEQTRKFKELQHSYQKDDGLPVHLKRGTTDKVLYYITWALIFVGLEESGRFLYSLK